MAGKPTMVFIPCFAGVQWDLAKFPMLTERYRCVSFDLLGQDVPMSRLTLDAYVEQVREVVAALQAPVVLVGDSFGGVIALCYALKYGQTLSSLVVSGAFARSTVHAVHVVMLLLSLLPGKWAYRRVLKLHAGSLIAPEVDDASVERDAFRLFADHTPRATFFARLRALVGYDVRPRLSELKVPTLVLSPEHDRLIGPWARQDLEQRIAGAQGRMLAGTGHLFRFTHPAAYEAEIVRFEEGRAVQAKMSDFPG